MSKKILIIEDEHILADMYADRFKQEKWRVVSATSSNEGLSATRSKRPDIVLLDMLLFNGHGLEYLAEKKEDEAIARIPVIVFSNLDDEKTKEEALGLGALENLLKTNYTPQELVARFITHLKK